MGIRVDTGKKEELRFANRKISFDSGNKSIHTGEIVIGAHNRVAQSESNNTINTKPSISNLKTSHEKRRNDATIDISRTTIMKRGQKISLNQKASDISKLVVGLEWEVNGNYNQNLDIDVSVFMVDGDNRTKEENFIFYNNSKSIDGGLTIDDDHSIGIKDCYDAVLKLDLNRVSTDIQKLAVTVTIDEADERNLSFKYISNAYLKIIDASKKKEILRYMFSEQLSSETAIVVAEIYRHKGEWKINTIGSGFIGGLQALCDNYGIETV